MNQSSMLVGFGLPHHVHVGMRQHPGVFVFRAQVQVIAISRMGARIRQSHSARALKTEEIVNKQALDAFSVFFFVFRFAVHFRHLRSCVRLIPLYDRQPPKAGCAASEPGRRGC
ncbi:hypothetical protein AP071_13230 [Rhodobacter capsulatus]|nr:hypothetical protein AP073_14725 [Rhodobacter capsulatus]KQB16127.1 hypothetical protein AP071_13230 [Rhodobacter capsulatus]